MSEPIKNTGFACPEKRTRYVPEDFYWFCAKTGEDCNDCEEKP